MVNLLLIVVRITRIHKTFYVCLFSRIEFPSTIRVFIFSCCVPANDCYAHLFYDYFSQRPSLGRGTRLQCKVLAFISEGHFLGSSGIIRKERLHCEGPIHLYGHRTSTVFACTCNIMFRCTSHFRPHPATDGCFHLAWPQTLILPTTLYPRGFYLGLITRALAIRLTQLIRV